MMTGVMLPRGEIFDGLAFREDNGAMRRQLELGPLEDFLKGGSASFHVVNDIIDRE